jgi:heme A synthase
MSKRYWVGFVLLMVSQVLNGSERFFPQLPLTTTAIILDLVALVLFIFDILCERKKKHKN